MSVENGAQAALMEALVLLKWTLVHDLGFGTIQEDGQQNSFVHANLCVFPQIAVVPDSFEESREGGICLG